MVRLLPGQGVRPREHVLGLLRARACRSLINVISAVSNFVYCSSFDALPLSIAVVVAHRGQPECANWSVDLLVYASPLQRVAIIGALLRAQGIRV